MVSNLPTILALDFDGVICDGLIEYFQTTWRSYCQIWQNPDRLPPEEIAPLFYQLRPAIETGWEMPVLVRSLLLGTHPDQILENWPAICSQIVTAEGLDPTELAAIVDGIRDKWIAEDLTDWLSLHRFYPGVIDRLQNYLASNQQLVIITTKEERFVRSLLQEQGIQLPEDCVFGKNVKRPKHQILRELLGKITPTPTIWFVEDRLKTLESVQKQLDLTGVKLYLADWGYNTPSDRTAAQNNSGIELLSLSSFCQDCSVWP
ncbi:HAD family hydrolase [Laspinema sp. D1]|nr:HAD family hydrolase [Laspinema sp. D2b]